MTTISCNKRILAIATLDRQSVLSSTHPDPPTKPNLTIRSPSWNTSSIHNVQGERFVADPVLAYIDVLQQQPVVDRMQERERDMELEVRCQQVYKERIERLSR